MCTDFSSQCNSSKLAEQFMLIFFKYILVYQMSCEVNANIHVPCTSSILHFRFEYDCTYCADKV